MLDGIKVRWLLMFMGRQAAIQNRFNPFNLYKAVWMQCQLESPRDILFG